MGTPEVAWNIIVGVIGILVGAVGVILTILHHLHDIRNIYEFVTTRPRDALVLLVVLVGAVAGALFIVRLID